MANIIDLITVGEQRILVVDADPSTGGGTSATLGDIAIFNNGTNGKMWLKQAASNTTGWDAVSTASVAGTVSTGTALRLALYGVSGTALSDTAIQNSQNITLTVATQATRSTALNYVIPNPGDAVTSAQFILSEGAQTINGVKTFGTSPNFGGFVLNNVGTPVATTDAANKSYVDSLIQGLNPKASVKAATTANITLSGTQTIDGIALVASDRCLVKNQSTASQNGIYVVSAGAWTRATDMDIWAEVPNAFVFIEQGSTQADTGWVCTSDSGGTLNTTSITFVQFAAAGAYTAGNGITLTGLSFSANLDANGGLEFNGSATRIKLNGATLDRSASGLKIADGGIADLQIASGANISITKIAQGTANQIVGANSGATANEFKTLSGTANQVVITHGAGTITFSLPQSIAAASTPTFGGLTLSNLTLGSVPFAGTAGVISQDNANLFFDDTNNRLGVGTNAPARTLDINGSSRLQGAVLQTVNGSTPTWEQLQATVNTTNATLTTIATIALATTESVLVTARIIGAKVSGGGAGVAGDGAAYIRTCKAKNIAGTVTIQTLQSDYTAEDQAGFNGTIAVSGTNLVIQVQGTATNNITWDVTYTVQRR